ncbi:MAG: hypothetical protein FWG90_04950 [Oscillospiraceae bacterium]|nr:hypothetical protein [Oscillospiraceae bacterium]
MRQGHPAPVCDNIFLISYVEIKPSGVYIRQRASSVPASFEQIREIIKLTDGDKFETARSLNQDLTFTAAADEFARQNVEFGEVQMRTLGFGERDCQHI